MKRLIIALYLITCLLPLTRANVVGGDISMLPEYERMGLKHKDSTGKKIPQLLPWLKEQGWTAMRVRIFVDPTKAPADEIDQGVRQDLEYAKALGARIKEAGFKLMVDFHYSDTWADPKQQTTPDAWKDLTDDALADTIYSYTRRCLQELIDAGATPDFIQTGNEISYGMLWGPAGTAESKKKKFNTGNSANDARFITLLNRSAKACRQACPTAKIIIHTELVRNITMMNNFYKAINLANADYDIIGLSYYPYYHYSLGQLESALKNLETNFPGKEIMIVEAGFYHKWQPSTGINYNYETTADAYGNTYPISHEGQRAFTQALVEKLLQHPAVTGLFWWFPEANEYGNSWPNYATPSGWYNAGLWDNETGRVLPALFELAAFAPAIEIVKGDVTGNGIVDLDDINAAINVMLGFKQATDFAGTPDVTGNGIIDIDDVNAIINIILTT